MPRSFREVDINELSELLHSAQNVHFGVGVHSAGLNQDSIDKREEIAKAILEKGIKIGQGYHSIMGNAQSLGRNFDLSNSGVLRFLQDDIIRRAGIEHNGNECKVIVAVPTILEENREDDQSSRIALGFPDRSIHSGSKAYEVSSFIDVVCEKMGEIPKEFVLGYLTDGKNIISINPDFYAFLDVEKQKELFDRISFCIGALRKASDLLLEQGEAVKDRIIASLTMNGFQNPEKFVESIIEENSRMNLEKMSKIEVSKSSFEDKNETEQKVSERPSKDENETEQSNDDLARKLGAFYDATHKRKLIFKRLDIDYAKENKRNY